MYKVNIYKIPGTFITDDTPVTSLTTHIYNTMDKGMMSYGMNCE